MSDSKKIAPITIPDSPPFADAGYAHVRGDVVTLLFMRSHYGPGVEGKTADGTAFAPVVASVTMTLEGARAVLNLISGVLPAAPAKAAEQLYGKKL